MDVLEYYDPLIDWRQFSQGGVSDDVWRAFCDAVRLCHSYRYWKEAAVQTRRSRPPVPFYDESKYMRRKRRQEWELGIKGHENHMYRAAFLAAEKLWKIADMVRDRKDSPDWHFSLALMHGVGAKAIMNTMTGHQRADFGVLAFDRFDADAEVSSDPAATARRWREAAGHGQDAA